MKQKNNQFEVWGYFGSEFYSRGRCYAVSVNMTSKNSTSWINFPFVIAYQTSAMWVIKTLRCWNNENTRCIISQHSRKNVNKRFLNTFQKVNAGKQRNNQHNVSITILVPSFVVGGAAKRCQLFKPLKNITSWINLHLFRVTTLNPCPTCAFTTPHNRRNAKTHCSKPERILTRRDFTGDIPKTSNTLVNSKCSRFKYYGRSFVQESAWFGITVK